MWLAFTIQRQTSCLVKLSKWPPHCSFVPVIAVGGLFLREVQSIFEKRMTIRLIQTRNDLFEECICSKREKRGVGKLPSLILFVHQFGSTWVFIIARESWLLQESSSLAFTFICITKHYLRTPVSMRLRNCTILTHFFRNHSRVEWLNSHWSHVTDDDLIEERSTNFLCCRENANSIQDKKKRRMEEHQNNGTPEDLFASCSIIGCPEKDALYAVFRNTRSVKMYEPSWFDNLERKPTKQSSALRMVNTS